MNSTPYSQGKKSAYLLGIPSILDLQETSMSQLNFYNSNRKNTHAFSLRAQDAGSKISLFVITEPVHNILSSESTIA